MLLPLLLLLLLSHFSRVQLCATPKTGAHQAPLSLGFSRQEHWSRLPFPSPMHESEKWKWSRVGLLATPWTAAYQAPSMGFSRQEYWSGLASDGIPVNIYTKFWLKESPTAGSRHIAYWVQHFPQHHLSGSGIAQLEFYHCWEPAWGAPPVTKVMRKEARHMQRRDWASGAPWKFLSIYPQNQSLPTFCFVLSPTPLTLQGAVPHYLSLKKELAYSSS